MKSSIFWVITPCSPLKLNRLYFPTEFRLVSCLAYSSSLKLEATCSSETSVDIQRTIRRYFPEDITLLECSIVDTWGCYLGSQLLSEFTITFSSTCVQ
jgi:hypothetical protein